MSMTVLYLVLLANLANGYNNHFCIDGDVIQNNKTCLESDSGTCCGSFSYLLNGSLPSSTEVMIISNTSLNETIYFRNLQDIALVGKNATVTCYKCKDSGLVFSNVTGLRIVNVVFEHCGSIQNITNTLKKLTVEFISAVYILKSSDTTIDKVRVINSTGTGIVFLDTNGTVNVSFSSFEYNRVHHSLVSQYSGGGGVRVELTYCASGLYQNCSNPKPLMSDSLYIFNECTFISNKASTVYPNTTSFVHGSGNSMQGIGDGGGLSISIKGLASNNTFNIENCIFSENSAVWGGGLFLQFQDFTKNNSVVIKNGTFVRNHAYLYGGGGADVGYVFSFNPTPQESAQKNNITFFNCSFQYNVAKSSGGTVSFFSNFYTTAENFIEFRKCNWTENKARFGSAIEVAPEVWETLGTGQFLSPLFHDCLFQDNQVVTITQQLDSDATYKRHGFGAFLVSRAKVQFQGSVIFTNNTGTALYLTSGVIEFLDGTYANFSDNSGQYGGAISLIGYSSIIVNNNSKLDFFHNQASAQGGAIHVQSTDEHKYAADRSCFIQYNGDDDLPVEKRNITFNFFDNFTPTGDGNAIYAASFFPCSYECSANDPYSPPFLQCLVTVHGQMDGGNNGTYNVASKAMNFTLEQSFNSSNIIPGEYFSIPLKAVDELGNEKDIVYQTSVQNTTNSSNVTLENVEVEYGPTSQLHLFGKSGESGVLVLTNDDNILLFNFRLGDCPPGYLWDSRNNISACYCSAINYFGLEKCNDTETRVYIQRGYWMGYCKDSQQKLCTGHCPVGFCNYGFPGDNASGSVANLLPKDTSELDDFICDSYRTGILCGSCREGYSAYYHSPNFRCGNETLCKWGILFYIASELIPVTVLFVLVMVFNVSFSSGKATGFILFAQIIDSQYIYVGGLIQFPKTVSILQQCCQVVYSFFNLNFFNIEELSFCLWKGAGVLDVIAMKYVTVVYALSLVILSVLIMRSNRIVRCFSCLRVRTLKTAFIHGITAFLIMCYSQCTKASIEVLSTTPLYSDGPTLDGTVLSRSGDTLLFHSDHLKYAVPALFFILVIVIIPPLLLVLHPLLFKALSYCKLNETIVATAVSRLIPIQLLDAFQGCYKDGFRFFAGFYFLYRMFILIAFAGISSMAGRLSVVEAILVSILTLHAIAQPYKKRMHNIIDSLIFANLAFINGITFLNYGLTISPLQLDTYVVAMSFIQIILISLPLLAVAFYLLGKSYFSWKRSQVTVDRASEDESTLPLLRDETDTNS